MVTSWTSAEESPALAEVIDRFVQSRPEKDSGWPVETVANTIFATDLYDRDAGPDALAEFCDLYLEGLEVARPASPGGEYCARMVAWDAEDGSSFNQLLEIGSRLRKCADPAMAKYNYSSNYELAIEHPLLDLRTQMPGHNNDPYGFPCLSHISLTVVKKKLHLSALYRNQHLVHKAFGNYLGLTRLCAALCHHSGLTFGSVTVVATHLSSELHSSKGFGKADLGALHVRALNALDEPSHVVLEVLSRCVATDLQELAAVLNVAGHIGVDVVRVDRFEDDFTHDRDVLAAAFTDVELKSYGSDSKRLAGHFAVKEAVVKALGTGFSGVGPLDIEVLNLVEGKPVVKLTDAAASVLEDLGFDDFMCTLSYEEGIAVAIAVAVNGGDDA